MDIAKYIFVSRHPLRCSSPRQDGEALCYHCEMLNIQNMTYLQGGIPLFQSANLQAFANQRIGLVGKNGCGKSTLFRLIRGEIKSDGGEVSLQSGKTLGFVEQEIANSEQAASAF